MTDIQSTNILTLTSQIVASYLGNNRVEASNLATVIKTVYGALESAETPPAVAEPEPVPAVPVRKSVFPDHIVCLEDGKKLKMLKRHLKTSYNISPEQYRAKWGLPNDYPMVAPNYAIKRSQLAKDAGLGRKRIEEVPEPVAAPVKRKGRTAGATT